MTDQTTAITGIDPTTTGPVTRETAQDLLGSLTRQNADRRATRQALYDVITNITATADAHRTLRYTLGGVEDIWAVWALHTALSELRREYTREKHAQNQVYANRH
jgi:hypothetical protein